MNGLQVPAGAEGTEPRAGGGRGRPLLLVGAALLVLLRLARLDWDPPQVGASLGEVVDPGIHLWNARALVLEGTPRFDVVISYPPTILHNLAVVPAYALLGPTLLAEAAVSTVASLLGAFLLWRILRGRAPPDVADTVGLCALADFTLFAYGRVGMAEAVGLAFGLGGILALERGRPAAAGILTAAAAGAKLSLGVFIPIVLAAAALDPTGRRARLGRLAGGLALGGAVIGGAALGPILAGAGGLENTWEILAPILSGRIGGRRGFLRPWILLETTAWTRTTPAALAALLLPPPPPPASRRDRLLAAWWIVGAAFLLLLTYHPTRLRLFLLPAVYVAAAASVVRLRAGAALDPRRLSLAGAAIGYHLAWFVDADRSPDPAAAIGAAAAGTLLLPVAARLADRPAVRARAPVLLAAACLLVATPQYGRWWSSGRADLRETFRAIGALGAPAALEAHLWSYRAVAETRMTLLPAETDPPAGTLLLIERETEEGPFAAARPDVMRRARWVRGFPLPVVRRTLDVYRIE